jgi:hypothetical protein
MIVFLPTLGFFLVALLFGRAWVLLLPAISWPLYFLGLHKRWWGHGVGDLWQYAVVGVTLLGLAAGAAGLALRALFVRRGTPRRRAGQHRL